MGKAEKKTEEKFFEDLLEENISSDEKFIKNFAGGVLHISELKTVQIATISLPPSQPRKYFDESALEELTESVRENGILEPLVVRRLEEGTERFELIAGERRLRAAKKAGLPIIPVNIVKADDRKSRELALIENLQREDLNPVEEVEAVLDYLATKLEKGRDEVLSALYRAKNESSGKSSKVRNNVIPNISNEALEDAFAPLGKYKIISFVANRLPVLNLPEDILEAVKKGALQYTKGRELAKLEAQGKRQALLKEAIAEKLSLNDIKKRMKQVRGVKAVKGKENKERSATQKKSRYRELLDLLAVRAEQYSAWDDDEACRILEQAIRDVDEFYQSR